MELRQLRYFVQIADAGSVRTAATRVRIAQSALSRQVAALEDELGVKLLERHARGVTPTHAGARLRARAVAILSQIEDIRAEIMAEGDAPAGTATIGASAGASRLLYGRLVEHFTDAYPQIKLNLVEGAPYLLLEGLDTGRIDLAVMVDPEPRPSLAFEPLATEQVYLIGALDDARLPAASAQVSDLAELPLILLPRPAGSRMSFERAGAAAGVRLNVAYEIDNQDVTKDLIARGLGFGLLPYSTIERDVSRKGYAALPVDGLTLSRTLVSRGDHGATPAVATLARVIRNLFNQLVEEQAFSGDIGAR
ncbi:MAG: LysR family transcriptional regulator [Pseudomonadota bacterium]|nr:LysR family transcriptional regulator [Pseudomonadota bacterium]